MTFLDADAVCLTKYGFKKMSSLKYLDDIYFIDLKNGIHLTRNYKISRKKVSTYFITIKNEYAYGIYNKPIFFNNYLEKLNNKIKKVTVKAYISEDDKDKKKYVSLDYITCLAISIIISNCFTKNKNGTLCQKEVIPKKFIFEILKNINKSYKIYFPRKSDSYSFKTNLFLTKTVLKKRLLLNINSTNKIADILFDLLPKGSYRLFTLDNYDIACLLQVIFSLSNYSTKIVKKGTLYNLVIVSSKDATYISKNILKEKKSKSKKEMFSVSLQKDSGYLITLQNIKDITTVSLIDITKDNPNS